MKRKEERSKYGQTNNKVKQHVQHTQGNMYIVHCTCMHVSVKMCTYAMRGVMKVILMPELEYC